MRQYHEAGSLSFPASMIRDEDLTQPPDIPDHQVIRWIGKGGYGVVWLALNTVGVYRAVKIVYRASFGDSKPFEREWSGICKFEPLSREHEGFVDLLHIGRDPQGRYFYYIMELADHERPEEKFDPAVYRPRTLKGEIDRRGSFSLPECIALGLALSDALAHLHKAGLVHRDIKPDNIVFVGGVPKLADIGLVARPSDGPRSFVGTDGYIPPEGPGTEQADIFALGMVLYEASIGRDRKDFPVAPAVTGKPPERHEFATFEEVIFCASHHDPRFRYTSAATMSADLKRLQQGKSVAFRQMMRRLWVRTKRPAVVVTGLITLAISLWGAYSVNKASEDNQRKATASAASGIQAMGSGDFLGALPPLVEALQIRPGNAARERAQRLRLGVVLDQCPKLTHLWFGDGTAGDGQFSPDGTKVLLARVNGEAEIYDVQSGRPRFPPLNPPPSLISAAYSADGKWLVTVSRDSVACIWKSGNFEEVRRFPHPCQLWGARFSPDALRLVTAGNDGLARVFDTGTGRLSMTLSNVDAVPFSAFSHDGHLIVTTSRDGTARLWDSESGKPVGAPLKHDGWVVYAAFSPDDRKLVTASLDRKAQVWDTATGARLGPDLEHRSGVRSAEFSPDGRFILTASDDGAARLWLADSLQPLPFNPILPHNTPLTHASFNPDGQRILTTCVNGSARIWDLAGAAGLPIPRQRTFCAEANRFLTICTNGVQVWDAESCQPVGPSFSAPPELKQATLDHTGSFVLTMSKVGSAGTFLQVWDVSKAQQVGPGITFTNTPAGVSLAEQGNRVVVFTANHVRTWDVLAGSPLSDVLSHQETISQSFFSHDGKHVATVSGHQVRVWDALNGYARCPPITQAEPVQAARFSPDGKYLAVGCSGNVLNPGYAQIYGTRTGSTQGARLNHPAGVVSVEFSADGLRLATAGADSTAIIWDAVSGRQLSPGLKHQSQVRSVAFSRDGRWLLTASADQTARIWDARTGEALTPFLRGFRPLARAGFLPDPSHIVMVDDEGSAQTWKLPVEHRPVRKLQEISRLLSDDAGSPATSESLKSLWQQVRTNDASQFSTSREQLLTWHELQAEDSERHAQWSAAAFHLQRLLSLGSAEASVTQRLASVRGHLPGH